MILKNKTNKVLFVVLIIGILISVFPFIFAKEQCPSGYTKQQVDISGCIIGADIGSGMIFMMGIGVIVLSVMGLLGSFVAARSGKSQEFSITRFLKFIGIVILALYVFSFI